MTTTFEFADRLVKVEVFTGSWSEFEALSGDGWATTVDSGAPMACRVSLGGGQVRPVEEGEPVVGVVHAAELLDGAAERPLCL